MGKTEIKKVRFGSPVVFGFQFDEESRPALLDISSLLYDIVLAHDFALLIGEKGYSTYKFSSNFWYRNGRTVRPNHQARVLKIQKNSPFFIEVVIPSLGAAWMLVQIIDKVQSWPLNRQKLTLEIEKLKLEIPMEALELQYEEIRLKREIAARQAGEIEGQIVQRLNESPVKLKELDIRMEYENGEPSDDIHEG